MQITGTTTLLGLIGTPVAHSNSPQMYNHCFQKFGLDYAYLAFDVGSEEIEAAVNAPRLVLLLNMTVTLLGILLAVSLRRMQKCETAQITN